MADAARAAAARFAPPLRGGGETGRLARGTDWSTTPLGDVSTWPQSLRSALSLVLNAKSVAALCWGPEQTLLYNDAYGAALGDRHPRAFGCPMPEILTDIAPMLGPQVAQVLTTGEGFAIENLPLVMHRHGRDEETVWTFSLSPVQGETGGFAGVLLLATETTAQKKAEQALQDVEARLREQNISLVKRAEASARERDRVWQHSKDMLGVADEQGVWRAISPAWTRTLGWQPGEIIGRTSEWMEHPDDRTKTRAEVGRLAAGQTTFEFENRFRTKAGDYRTLTWTAVPDAGQLYCVARDITEERARAAAQADAERVHLALAAGAIIGTWFWDLPTDRFTIDEAFATAFGLDPALGREGIPLARIVATVHPDDQAGLADAINEAVKRGGHYAHQYRVRRKDGRYHWLEAIGHVEHASDGTPLRFPGVLVDVSARRLTAAFSDLSERLRTLETPEDMALAAAEAVGSALSLSRVAYGDIDATGRCIVIRPNWLADGQPSIAGTHELKNYGSYVDELRRGDDVIIDDVAADPRTASQTEVFETIDTRALVNLPLMERGQLKVVFCLNQRQPYAWSADEVAFARRVMDRTEVEIARREAERELRANEARQRQLLKQMPGFVGVLTGPDHVFEYVNDAYIAISGPRDFIGRTVREVFPDLEGQGFFESLDRVYATGEPFAAKGAPLRLSGEAADRFIDHMYEPVRDEDGVITGIFVGGYEVTEQVRSTRALRNLNADLERKVTERALARGRTWQVSPDLLVVINRAGIFEALNPAWTATLGWSEEELTRTVFSDFVHPDDLAETQAVWRDANERGLPVLRFENRYRHKDGGWRWLSWVGVPDDGKVYCSARDITPEKEQTASLSVAEEALRQSQKMEAVGQLTGGLAHDFNNLLAVVTGNLELMATRIGKGKFDDLPRFMASAQAASKRATSLTHRLLAFSRRQTLAPKATGISELVDGMRDMVNRTVGPEITVAIATSAKLWTTFVDPNQLENALLNLCINARDAMPDGGRLTVETSNQDLGPGIASIRDLPAGQYVALSVSDTGTGMSPDIVARVFEPFFTTKPTGQGTGLGLSMVYGFARQSGGQVRIHSEVGHGTNVTIYLPRSDKPLVADAADAIATPQQAERGQTVLIVDDEAAVRILIKDVLSDLGYSLIEAKDGPSALKILQDERRVDLLITDVGMPGMNGRQLADAARTTRPHLKTLFITGYAEASVISHGHLDAGMAIITKPFALDVLANRVEGMIDAPADR